jgi:hypothetical protein
MVYGQSKSSSPFNHHIPLFAWQPNPGAPFIALAFGAMGGSLNHLPPA